MRVRYATETAPGRRVNEDYVVDAGSLVGVLDGVSVPAGIETGCFHGPAWYVRQLGGRLIEAAAATTASLADVLAAAISGVRGDHSGQCDLDNPQTPAATVCLVREAASHIEYLVLCDSYLVLDRGGDPLVVTDARFDASIAEIRRVALAGVPAFDSADSEDRLRQAALLRQQHTNRPGGYWIAAAQPDAAYEAITGTVPLVGADRVRRAALLTDGASRAVDQFALFDWRGLLDLLASSGPDEVIRRVRIAEHADHAGERQPRYKRHDDATAVLCEFGERE